MADERFYKTKSSIEDYRIYDNDLEDAYFISGDEHTVDCIIDLLNRLNDENQRLKLENGGLRYALKNIKQIDVEIDIGDYE